MDERYEFFAPIWRVMRDSNMTAAEVKEQVSYVALVTKQASQVSDLRGHTYTAPRVSSPVVYFRGMTPGVCTYFDDRKGPNVPMPHGACWYNRCEDLRVIDVPGDHFSLLRQDLDDMNVLVTGLKMILGPFGWAETLRREDKPAYEVSSEEIQDIDAYLRKMGVKDPSLRQRLETAMPYASADGVDSALALAAANGAHHAVAPINPAAKEALKPGSHISPGDPTLVVCCDANGSLGGLDPIFSTLAVPVFAVRLPADQDLWESADVPELATVAVKSLQRALPPGTRDLILAGVGFGGVLAHEMVLQLDAVSDRVAAFALFEGTHIVPNPNAALSWVSPELRREVCQAGAAVYPAVAAAVGAGAPSMDAFVARLASISGFEGQLDYVASFKPRDESVATWDARIDSALARLGYFKTITDSYAPGDVFPGQTLVFSDPDSIGNGVAQGGPGGVWQSIRFLVQPASVHALRAGSSTPRAAQILSPSPVAAALAEHLRASVQRRVHAEERVSGPSALSLMSPRMDIPPTQQALDSPSNTMCLILPLNRLCPERRYILRRAGRSGTPRQLAGGATPLTRLPLWMVHTERGDLSAAQKELAAALPMPCYGLGMGADADQCTSIFELAAAYCAAVVEMQPSGPYLVMGSSIVGSLIAHAMVTHFQTMGRPAALIVLDGCVGTSSVPLHDATWYALFYLLREIGSLRGAIGEFVDFVRGAGSPSQQLKLLASFKPAELGVAPEAWDAAVYATLDRAAALKRLLRASGDGEGAPREVFDGPTALVVPRDRLGRSFVDASRPYLSAQGGPVVVPLEARHTETLLSPPARGAAAVGIASAVHTLLERLG